MTTLRRFFLMTAMLVLASAAWTPQPAQALNLKRIAGTFDLDSMASWGAFPRLCVNVYRWGDRFFNTYDSAYVRGTGYRMNLKVRSDSWMDQYIFLLPNNMEMNIRSDAATSMGLYVTYMAVSVGYDINVSNLITGNNHNRKRWSYGFNCSLFSAEGYWQSNSVGTSIRSFGKKFHTASVHIPFDGLNTNEWGLNVYYFFNHKRYSQAAAFNYSKIQRRSQGSWFAGINLLGQNFDFDFTSLPAEMKKALPPSWKDFRYHVSSNNYAIKGGYGFNWVWNRHWIMGVLEAPTIGWRHGRLNRTEGSKNSVSLYNQFMLSVVWNNGRWFAGAVGRINTGLIYDKEHSLLSNYYTMEISAGWRFNLW